MLIQEIIRQQTIGILNKILQNSNHEKSENKRYFTVEQYVNWNLDKNLIKTDEKQILMILLNKHLQNKNQSQKSQKINEFSYEQAIKIVQQIKKSITNQKNIQKGREGTENDSNLIENLGKNSIQSIQVNDFTPQINKRKSNLSNKQQEDPQISSMSKRLKKQNQFIMRNIDRIKKYATPANQPLIDYQRTQLQQIKISHEISHKLFHLYKGVFPSGVTNKEMLNFQTKEQFKSTLNYHKISQIFIDAQIKLQIAQKLSLLRMVKKFSFNQNFIQLQEWVKIYRGIINNLDVKQVILQRLVKSKEEEKKSSKFIQPKQNPQIQIKIPKTQAQYRTRRIKTEASIPESRFISMGSIIKQQQESQSFTKNDYMTNKNGIRPIGHLQKTESYKTYNPNQYRSKHKKLLKNVNEVIIKNLKKDLRSQKMIGLADRQKTQNQQNTLEDNQNKNEFSYLRKAIKAKKISKITWQSLFEMKQETMHHNIVIPQFARYLQNE